MILAIDVGNSRVHLARFEGTRRVDRVDIPATSGPPVETWLPAAETARLVSGVRSVWIASVNPPVSDALEDWLRRQSGLEPVRLGGSRGRPVPLVNRTADPAGVGIDRLLNAYGAWRRTGRGCVVIACGSAVTVDVVTAAGEFLGGAILPGLRTALDALHARCAQLPALALETPPAAVGRTTREAMLSGIVYGAAGAIRHLAERMQRESVAPLAVVITGGDAPFLAPFLAGWGDPAPDLTLEAIRDCADPRP